MIFVSGIFIFISVYFVLFKSLICIIMGIILLIYVVNLFLIIMGGLKYGIVLIFEKGILSYVDFIF